MTVTWAASWLALAWLPLRSTTSTRNDEDVKLIFLFPSLFLFLTKLEVVLRIVDRRLASKNCNVIMDHGMKIFRDVFFITCKKKNKKENEKQFS